MPSSYEPEVNEYGQIVAGLCEFCDLPIVYEADGDWDGERFVDCGVWVTNRPFAEEDNSVCTDNPIYPYEHSVLL